MVYHKSMYSLNQFLSDLEEKIRLTILAYGRRVKNDLPPYLDAPNP